LVHFAYWHAQANAVSWQAHHSCHTAGAPDRTAPQRKRVRSYSLSGHAHELTFSCFRRLPLLSRDRTRRWFVDALENARRDLDLALWAHVIIPEPVHVLCWPRQRV
jgi:putative transposase